MHENMEAPPPLLLTVNKRYFIEDKFLVVDCLYDQKKIRPLLKDWIGLYPCENLKLDEPLIFEYVMDHPRKDKSCFKIRFIPQLFAKLIHCSGEYQFVYVDSYFKIIATSCPIQFVHKNDCNCNMALGPVNSLIHIKMGQDIDVVIQRLKCLEAKLHDYEKGKKEAIELNQLLVKKLKACEMLRSRGEQFIDGLYNALDQGKPVKLINSKGHSRWIKRIHTNEIRNYIVSTKTIRNDLYLTAVINTQEQKIQSLQVMNNELKIKLSKYNEQFRDISEPNNSDNDNSALSITKVKAFTINSTTPAVVKFIDDSEISDDYCD